MKTQQHKQPDAQALAPTEPPTITPDASPGVSCTITLDLIRPSPHNPRKTFNEAELREMADSIRQFGVIEPIVVRPTYQLAGPGGRPGNAVVAVETYHEDPSRWPTMLFELVAGERRIRAAKLAGLTEVPAMIRRLSDLEADAIRCVENDQRADVPLLERVAGYADLMERHHISVEDLAVRLGKSVSAIRSMLKLLKLPKNACAAIADGRLPESVAALIARVPGDLHRRHVAECVIAGCLPDWVDEGDLDNPKWKPERPRWVRDEPSPLTFRQTKELIQTHCYVELKSANFSRKALDLVPAAGSCDACPKRAGNDPELTADGVRADVCTDPACFREKVEANTERIRTEAESSGRKVLSGKQAEELFGYGGRLESDAPYVDLGDKIYDYKTGKQHEATKLLRGCAGEAVVAIDPDGRPHQLVPRDVAAKVLKEKGITLSSGGSGGPPYRRTKTEQEKADEARRRETERIRRETNREMLGRSAVAGEMLFVGTLKDFDAEVNQVLRAVARRLADSSWSEIDDVCARRGIKVESKTKKKAELDVLAGKASGPELMGLIVELTYGRSITAYQSPDAKLLGTLLKVGSQKENEKRAKDRLKAEKADRAKAPTVKSAARKTKAPDKILDDELVGNDDWRKLPISQLDLATRLDAHLAANGIETLGQLHANLDSIRGLKPAEVERLRALVEDAREGSMPHKGREEERA